MAVVKLYNLARMNVSTTGTGTSITLAGAVAGFLTLAQAGASNGETIRYGIEDGANREEGTIVYTASGTTAVRTVLKSTNSNNPINLSGSAQLFATSAAEDFRQIYLDDGTVGSPSLTFGSDPTNGMYRIGSNHYGLAVNGAQVLDLSTAGLGVTGLLDLSGSSSGQISFPATQNPSAGANVLDDYEEGTWTPALNFGGGSTGMTYTAQSGTYCKIGQMVQVQINLFLLTKGSSVGSAGISGLPFTSSALFSVFNPYLSGLNSATAQFMIGVNASGTTCFIQYLTAGAVSQADNTTFNDTSILLSAGTYRATA